TGGAVLARRLFRIRPHFRPFAPAIPGAKRRTWRVAGDNWRAAAEVARDWIRRGAAQTVRTAHV
ncbi:hypothetical protein QN367_01990, partial [Cryobacterium sp. RTS3]|uniref:hypothetical protein n=1 Tax=Cryobacterium sp. RTS3 TaxID=3048643 RepID=UPI002B228711